MKNKKEIIQEELDKANEQMFKLELTYSFYEKKQAEDPKHPAKAIEGMANSKREMTQLQEWVDFLNEQNDKKDN